MISTSSLCLISPGGMKCPSSQPRLAGASAGADPTEMVAAMGKDVSKPPRPAVRHRCRAWFLYTSDAADERTSVEHWGGRII